MLRCNIEQLLGSFRLLVAELVNQGVAGHTVLEHWDDVSVDYTRELMAFLWETSDVISEQFAWLLLAALQIPGVTRMHVHTLEVAGEDLSEAIPTSNDSFLAGNPARPWRNQLNRLGGTGWWRDHHSLHPHYTWGDSPPAKR
jgi:hypothetical protein